MIKVKVSFPNDADYLRQLPNRNSEWDGIQFFINDETDTVFDYWVIFGNLENDKTFTLCDKTKTILVTTEPKNVHKYPKRFIDQFGYIITAQEEIVHPNKLLMPEGQLWFLKMDYDKLISLVPPKKDKKLSMLLSSKVNTKEHYERVSFALKLKEHFGDLLDWYGSGIKPFENKWDVLAPYKYSIVLESASLPYYLSEKLSDAFLCYTYPFYFGCRRVEAYYDPRSYTKIDLSSVDKTILSIETVLNSGDEHYTLSLPYIKQNREKYLKELQFFANLKDVIKKIHNNQFPSKIENVVLEKDYLSIFEKVKNKFLHHKNPISQKILINKIHKLI